MRPVKLRIESEADLKGFAATDAAFAKARDEMGRFIKSGEEAARVGGKIREGFTWADSFKLALGDRALSGLQQIPSLIGQGVREGVMFNATMGDAETAIGNVLQKFGGLNKEAARREAGAAMQQIVELEPKAAGGLSDLVQGFMATAASAQAVGMSTSQNIDLVGKFANGLANANIPAEQLSQEMRAIFSGNITPDAAFAKIIGITNQDVERAKEAGNLYDVLNEKIGTLGEAGDTFAVTSSSFQSALDKMLGAATKPFFDELTQGLKEATELLNNPDLAAKIREVATATGLLIDAGKGAAAAWKDASAEGFLGMNGASVAQALGWWRDIGLQISGADKMLEVWRQSVESAKSLNTGADMTKALGLIGAGERAGTPEAQAAARKAIETEIAAIKGRVARGEIEAGGQVAITLRALEKSLEVWDQIAGRSAEMRAEMEKAVAPTKEQVAALERGAEAAQRAGEALDAAFTERGDRVSTPEDRLQRMSERMQALRDDLDRDYRRAGGAGGLEGLDFDSARAQIDRGGVADADRAALLEKLRQILGLEREITREAGEQHKAALDQLKTAEERQRKSAEMIANLEEELAIQTQVASGHTTAAKLLEIQRDLRKEIAGIMQSDLAPAEKERAAELARQTAEMKEQKELAEQAARQKEAREKAADFSEGKGPAFDPALRGGKGARARKEDRAKYESEFRKVAADMRQSGMSYTEIDRAREEAMKEYDRKARERRGRFGGSATPSIADRPLGKTGDDVWSSLFPQAPAAGAAPAPGSYESAIADALRDPAGFAAAQRGPLGDSLPQPTQPIDAGGAAAEEGKDAAGAVAAAGEAGAEAATALKDAAGTLQDGMDSLAEVPGEVTSVASTLAALGPEIKAAFDQLKTSIEDVRNTVAGL